MGGLPEIVTYPSSIENAGAKKELQRNLKNSISEGQSQKEIISELRENVKKHGLSEPEAVSMIWAAVMSACEWNKKEDLLQEQALKHLKEYISLFKIFTTNARSELVLCNKIQEFCYDNQNFLKCFNKIILLFYKTEVLSEEVILKWYKDGHAPKGWTVFMDQMKKFVEWLEQAESGLRAQRLGTSLGAVLTLGEASYLHPWLQEAESLLPKRSSAAVMCTKESLRHPEDWSRGRAGVVKVFTLLAEGSAVLDSQAVEDLVQKMLAHGGDEEIAKMVWRASQSGRLDLDDGTLARMLETHESLLVSLVEEFLVEGLQCFEANLDVVSAPSSLVRAVATSCELYTKTLAVLETHLVQASFDVRLVQLFQARHRALVFLLSAFDDFCQGGQGEEAAKEII